MRHKYQPFAIFVLIESDWNLKQTETGKILPNLTVLIESDWNLKFDMIVVTVTFNTVLIESDWNLKSFHRMIAAISCRSINRIRLEFKVLLPVL